MYTNSLKKLSVFSLIIALGLLCASSPAALVHYWSLDDETLADGGTGLPGYLPQAGRLIDPSTEYTPPVPGLGRLSGGYDFGSANPLIYSDILIGGDNISQSTVPARTLPSPPLTFSTWFYLTQTPPANGVWYLVGNWYASNNQDRFYLSLGGNTAGQAGICFSIGATKDWDKQLDGPFTIPVSYNTWHHIMMSVKSVQSSQQAEVTLVLDGGTPTVITTTAGHSGTSLNWVFDNSNIRVGTNGNGIETGKTFHGYIDDVAIWNQILPTSAATFMWNGGTGRTADTADGLRSYDPIPGHRSVGNAGTTKLQWRNATGLASSMCNVFFSTVRDDLIDPNTNITKRPGDKRIAYHVMGTPGSLSEATLPDPLPEADVYYWRVDTLNTNYPVDPNIYAGPVWQYSVTNAVPQVDAGPDRYTYPAAGTIQISGTVTDDGLPSGATVTCTWKDSGGTPITTNVVQVDNTYTCTATVPVGAVDTVTTYTLVGNDTTGDGSDSILVTVKATPCAAAKANPTYVKNRGDVDDDCFVTFKDYALVLNTWNQCTALDEICN